MDGAMSNTSDSGAKMVSPCPCSAIGQGVQTFRIHRPSVWFKRVAELSPAPQLWLSARSVWTCLYCGQFFAWMRIPYKDEEEIIVRAETNDYANWDWAKLSKAADDCRWRGPGLDVRYIL